ncbi:MAG TPA: hypothetical protein VMD99_16830 [Terriglobales bacterium]|nr:hypothetical protein [Terriglobales bacterium]
MPIDPKEILDLINAVEYLLIENAVYEQSIKVIQRLLSGALPQETLDLVQKAIQTAQADPATQAKVREKFESLRAQLQTSQNQEAVIEALLLALPTKAGPLN